MSERDLVVIGGGLAGLQAAIMVAKAGEDVLLVDANDSWVTRTGNIENLIGFDSVAGSTLIESGRRKLDEFGGERLEATVERVERADDGLTVVADAESFETEFVILASAGNHDHLEPLDLDFEDGVEGQYYMDRHVRTDAHNKAAEGVYAAGLTRSWEFQTSVAIGDGAKAAVNLLAEKYGEPYMDHDV